MDTVYAVSIFYIEVLYGLCSLFLIKLYMVYKKR